MHSSKNWELHTDPSVLKSLKKMPPHNVEAILTVLRLLPVDPFFGDIQKMRGEENVWRRRIGSYRLFYQLKFSDNSILVFHLERRTSKTY